MNNPLKVSLIILFIVALVSLRFTLLDYANFAPITAAGIFSIYYFKNKKVAFLLPILLLFVSDCILQITNGYGLYFARTIDYFGVFAAMGFAYLLFQQSKSTLTVLGSAAMGSLVFFLISNTGVWATGTMYAQNFGGWLTALEMGIPFYKGTLIGDVLFTVLFFGGFEVLKSVIPQLSTQQATF